MGVLGGVIATKNTNSKPAEKVEAAYDSRLHIVGNGTFGSWTPSGAVQMVSDGSSNTAKKTGLTISANTEFKIAYIDNGSIQWDWDNYGSMAMDNKSYTFAQDASGNIKLKYDGKYNIFLTNSYKVYMSRDLNITFNPNSGTVSPTSKTVTQEYSGATNKYGDLPTPTREGYTFDGWYTESSGGTKVTKDSSIYSLTANQTLYAHWTPSVYTITYDRNMNTGLQATQSKNHGSNVNAYTPGTAPLTNTGWNPSAFKRFVHWNTDYQDKGTTYLAGATISANSSFYLYYIEDWYNYRYKVNNGSWVELLHNDAGKGDGIKVQFAPETAQRLPLNGILYFQYSDNGKSTWKDLSSASITFEGNYNTTTGIALDTIDTIYLKITDSNTYTCWVPGISDRTAAVFDSSSATTGGTAYTMRGNGDSETVTTEDVPVKKGQFVRRGYFGNYTYGSYFAGGTGDAATCFETYGDNVAVECLITGVYTVYNQKGSYDSWADLYFTRNNEASAALLAQIFNEIIAPICTAASGGSALSALQAVWGSVSTTTLYSHFHGQFTATMAYFKTDASTSDPDIMACVARYDYIVLKYGTTALPDFLGRNNGYQPAPRSAARLALLGNGNIDMNAVVITSIISVISIASVGGYFLLRRKKQK